MNPGINIFKALLMILMTCQSWEPPSKLGTKILFPIFSEFSIWVHDQFGPSSDIGCLSGVLAIRLAFLIKMQDKLLDQPLHSSLWLIRKLIGCLKLQLSSQPIRQQASWLQPTHYGWQSRKMSEGYVHGKALKPLTYLLTRFV